MKLWATARKAQFQIDRKDFEDIQGYNWNITHEGYVRASDFTKPKQGKSVLLHRFLLKAKPGEIVDHINGDKLDNRRSNLRIVTAAQNVANKRAIKGTSKYKGVWLQTQCKSKKWVVHCRKKYIGIFNDEKEAAKAYNEAASREFGEYAYLNKV